MNKSTLLDTISELLVDRFLIHFVPGFVLYLGIMHLISVKAGEGWLSVLIIGSCSWTLGLILEVLAFNPHYKPRDKEGNLDRTRRNNLLMGKLGLAIILNIAMGFINLLLISELFTIGDDIKGLPLMKWLIPTLLVLAFGVVLYARYLKAVLHWKEES